MTIGIMIPIKENSQRVPNKTFRLLGGKPLAYWVVDTLLEIEDYDIEIWINTDSQKVIDLYKAKPEYKDLKYYIRPDDVRGHKVSMNTVIDDWMIGCGSYYSYYLQTHITNPFVPKEYFEEALKSMNYYSQTSHRSVMGVTRHQCRMWHQSYPVNFRRGEVLQTQELKPVFEDNSCFYAFDFEGFSTDGRVSPQPYMIEVSYPHNVDIDTEDDWDLAKILCERIM